MPSSQLAIASTRRSGAAPRPSDSPGGQIRSERPGEPDHPRREVAAPNPTPTRQSSPASKPRSGPPGRSDRQADGPAQPDRAVTAQSFRPVTPRVRAERFGLRGQVRLVRSPGTLSRPSVPTCCVPCPNMSWPVGEMCPATRRPGALALTRPPAAGTLRQQRLPRMRWSSPTTAGSGHAKRPQSGWGDVLRGTLQRGSGQRLGVVTVPRPEGRMGRHENTERWRLDSG